MAQDRADSGTTGVDRGRDGVMPVMRGRYGPGLALNEG
jgi:hypothetical protein